jgi:hypothetical protein
MPEGRKPGMGSGEPGFPRGQTNELDSQPTKGRKPVRIYIFKSEARPGLRAFAGDPAGGSLPQQHGPWTAIGVVRPEADPPHKFSRVSIERAIEDDGFQLWRLKAKAEVPA